MSSRTPSLYNCKVRLERLSKQNCHCMTIRKCLSWWIQNFNWFFFNEWVFYTKLRGQIGWLPKHSLESSSQCLTVRQKGQSSKDSHICKYDYIYGYLLVNTACDPMPNNKPQPRWVVNGPPVENRPGPFTPWLFSWETPGLKRWGPLLLRRRVGVYPKLWGGILAGCHAR